MEDAFYIDRPHAIEVGVGAFEDVADGRDAGVVDKNIDPARRRRD